MEQIILVDKVSPSPTGLAALDKLLVESNKLHPSVYIVASYIWTRASQRSGFMDAFPETSSARNVFVLQDYSKERVRDTLVTMARANRIEFERGPNGAPLRMVVERLCHNRGTAGFRNALLSEGLPLRDAGES